MINVQYPFLDLTEALITLLKKLKPTDWDRITLLNNYKISTLANKLIKFHGNNLTQLPKVSNYNIGEVDTVVDIKIIKVGIDTLENILNKERTVGEVSETQYCYCWLLQQYIRQALNNQHLLEKAFYFPFLNSIMQSFTSHYQFIEAKEAVIVKAEIVGDAGGVWLIEKTKTGWSSIDQDKPADVTIYLDQQIAWLLFSNTLHVNEIGQFYQLFGDKQLRNHFLNMRINIVS